MKRFLFVVLALVVLLVVPVSAWTSVSEFTIGDNDVGGGFQGIGVANMTTFCLGTNRFTLDGTLAYWYAENGALSKTTQYNFTNGNNWALVTLTATSEDYTNYSKSITWDATIDACHASTNGPVKLRNATSEGAAATGMAWATHEGWTSTEPSGLNDVWMLYHASQYVASGHYTVYGGDAVPVAAFTCTPTSQYPDTNVVCTDTSTEGPSSWLWTIDAEGMGIEGWLTSTSQNFTWQSHYPGLYSVNLRATSGYGSDWENKSSYVSIGDNATPNNCNIPVVPGLIRSWAQCVDSQTSGAVAGCDLSLYDLEGGAWSNVTDRFDGTWCIDTYPSHHFHAYGSADNYTPDPTYRLNLPVSSSVVYELLMHPGYVPAAADGKVWLYVIVNDADTGASLVDAHVSISGSGQTTKSDVTDSTGSVHIQWVNASTAYVTATKSGYTSGSKTVTTSDFGPDTVRIELHRSTVTPTATATTGPGGTVPTTASPWGTPGPYGTMPSGYTNAQGQMAMDYLAANGLMLVQLCVLVTICALLGFKFGK